MTNRALALFDPLLACAALVVTGHDRPGASFRFGGGII